MRQFHHPAILWYAYLYCVLPASALSEGFIPRWFIPYASTGILLRTVDPRQYPQFPAGLDLLVRTLDVVALCATLALFVASVILLRRRRPAAAQMAVLLYLGLAVAATDRDFRNAPYGYARSIAPLFVPVLAGAGATRIRWLPAAMGILLLLVDLRVFAEIEPQAIGMLHLVTQGWIQ